MSKIPYSVPDKYLENKFEGVLLMLLIVLQNVFGSVFVVLNPLKIILVLSFSLLTESIKQRAISQSINSSGLFWPFRWFIILRTEPGVCTFVLGTYPQKGGFNGALPICDDIYILHFLRLYLCSMDMKYKGCLLHTV